MKNRLAAFCCLLLLTACAVAPPPSPAPVERPEQTTVSKPADVETEMPRPVEVVRSDEVVIVGRVEISPPLLPVEQGRLTGPFGKLRGKAALVRGQVNEPLPEFSRVKAADRIDVTLAEDFLLTFPHRPLYLLGGFVFVNGADGQVEEIPLPGDWQLDIRADDRAIYIGTINYIRNEFDVVLDYIVDDDYPEAYETFRQKYDRDVVLRKALVRNPRIK